MAVSYNFIKNGNTFTKCPRKHGVEFAVQVYYCPVYVTLGPFQTLCYSRAKLARLWHGFGSTWFQTPNLSRTKVGL